MLLFNGQTKKEKKRINLKTKIAKWTLAGTQDTFKMVVNSTGEELYFLVHFESHFKNTRFVMTWKNIYAYVM